jgi:signal transduction histidine kinase
VSVAGLAAIVALLVKRRRRPAVDVSGGDAGAIDPAGAQTMPAGAEQAEAERAEAERLVEARSSAILRAIPDLMFVMDRDGRYVDCPTCRPSDLFISPEDFLGKNVRDVMPPDLAASVIAALHRACDHPGEPVIVEYELPMSGSRRYEARLVAITPDRILMIARDVTAARRGEERQHDLAGRLISAQEVERERIAHELHDDISQKLALLNIGIEEAASRLGKGAPERLLRELSGQAGEIATDVHNLSYALHPSRLQTIGLTAAVDALCRELGDRSRLRITFAHSPMPPSVGPEASLCVYRVAQEALRNIGQHSRAGEGHVELRSEPGQLLLQVSDRGVGFNPAVAPSGLGLVTLRERVAFLRGELTIDSAPGKGTRLRARVPTAIVRSQTTRLPQSA